MSKEGVERLLTLEWADDRRSFKQSEKRKRPEGQCEGVAEAHAVTSSNRGAVVGVGATQIRKEINTDFIFPN